MHDHVSPSHFSFNDFERSNSRSLVFGVVGDLTVKLARDISIGYDIRGCELAGFSAVPAVFLFILHEEVQVSLMLTYLRKLTIILTLIQPVYIKCNWQTAST